jgi:CheY-like chemotaxis protein
MPMMDGIALAHAAKREHPNLVILLMTGFADQRERAADLRDVVTDVLTKPFSLAEVRAAVARALLLPITD